MVVLNINLTGKQAVMAGRILNRRELRKQADQAELNGAAGPDPASAGVPEEPVSKRKTSGTPKERKPRKPKAPPRTRALWCVYDGGMKEIALFDFNQRATAEEKLAAMLAKQKGVFFLQLVKKPMLDLESAEPSSGH